MIPQVTKHADFSGRSSDFRIILLMRLPVRFWLIPEPDSDFLCTIRPPVTAAGPSSLFTKFPFTVLLRTPENILSYLMEELEYVNKQQRIHTI